MTLVRLTIMSQDDLDGEPCLIHKDDIRNVVEGKTKKKDLVLIGQGDQFRYGSFVVLIQGGVRTSQMFAESLDEIEKLVNG